MSFLPRTSRKKETPKKTKLAKDDKSKKRYCRNCLKQMEVNSRVCGKCGMFHKDGGMVTKPR